MVVMLHYDMLVLFKDGEVRTIGTGWNKFDLTIYKQYILYSLNFLSILG